MNYHNAIVARANGVFDDPDLMAFGPLSTVAADVTELKRQLLESEGWIVGAREPRLNTDFPGAYMVAEPYEQRELPTRDGSNGPWCVVGDDLNGLIAEAYDAWVSIHLS